MIELRKELPIYAFIHYFIRPILSWANFFEEIEIKILQV
jgi:hypothetical protein